MTQHPGIIIQKLLESKNMSQRELASLIQIAPSHLNNIISGERGISAEIALKLEAAGFSKAIKWLNIQNEYDLSLLKGSLDNETSSIKIWGEIQNLLPVNFLKKQGYITDDRDQNIKNVFKLFRTNSIEGLQQRIFNFEFKHYRKSQAFIESKNNVIAWSFVAEDKARKERIEKEFNHKLEAELILKLKNVFNRNDKLKTKTKKLLSSYGIKFLILDRPPKTPVDGKSFMSGKNPTIVLSMKYKRLDNFAYNILHELGHVFLHLTNSKYKEESFFTNNSSNDLLEFEANQFAMDKLIPKEKWEEFILSYDEYTDDAIEKLSRQINLHPSIIRGRVCFEFNNYYRRPSRFNDMNKIDEF